MREFELIAALEGFLSRGGPGSTDGLVLGHGDDAAVLDPAGDELCLTVDTLVEGIHFRWDLSEPADVGWKAIAAACSDLAAMGARPMAAIVALCLADWSSDRASERVRALYEGMRAAGRRWGLELIGGDTVTGPALVLSVTAVGRVARGAAVTRGGARPGDALVVVGPLGAPAAALAAVRAGREPTPAHLAAHRRPAARIEAGQILARHGAHALIDVSDGLAADLAHICAASQVAARVQAAALPLAEGVAEAAERLGLDVWDLACGGGEDYALAAALPPAAAAAAAREAAAAESTVGAVVGEVVSADAQDSAVVIGLSDGTVRTVAGLGYEHEEQG